jgi:hypothetical protein
MTTKAEGKIQIAQKIEWRDEQFPSVYSNVATVGITPFDISIFCGEVESASPEAVKAKGLVKLILAPEQASLLAVMLSQAVKQLTDASGPLRTPGNAALLAEQMKIEQNR